MIQMLLYEMHQDKNISSVMWHGKSILNDSTSLPCTVGLTVPCEQTYQDCSVRWKILSFMMPVEKMGLAQDYVKLSRTVEQKKT